MSTATFLSFLGSVLVFVLWLALRPAAGSREAKLLNTPETEIHALEQLPALMHLAGPGTFVVKTFRQSGNPQKEDLVFADARKALASAMSTFKRSKIEFVVVMTNSEDEFGFRRPWHDHKGSSEGKKVGWIEIHRA